jgi:hypothetical protein
MGQACWPPSPTHLAYFHLLFSFCFSLNLYLIT